MIWALKVMGVVLLVVALVIFITEYCLGGLRDRVCTPIGEHPDDDPYLKGGNDESN